MNYQDWCVVWGAHSRSLHVIREEQLLNVNGAALLDGRPGFATVRANLTRSAADKIANAMQEMVNQRKEPA